MGYSQIKKTCYTWSFVNHLLRIQTVFIQRNIVLYDAKFPQKQKKRKKKKNKKRQQIERRNCRT